MGTEQLASDQSTPTEESRQRRQPEEPNVALTQGQVNAVRATFNSETIRNLPVRCAQGAGQNLEGLEKASNILQDRRVGWPVTGECLRWDVPL